MPEANVRRWGVGNPDLQTTVSRSRRRDGGHGAKIVQSGDGVWAIPTSSGLQLPLQETGSARRP